MCLESEIKICKRCVMDNVKTDISFSSKGVCNYCETALKNKDKLWLNNREGKKILEQEIKKMKDENKDKKYDCILGLSGGIDSCYTAYFLAKYYNVRILAIHVDGGWNTEISEKNIKKLCQKLKIDLKIIKKDYKEMYELQRAYFMSEVINQDVPQDNIFFAELHKETLKSGINWVAEGQNYSSESILPNCWKYDAMDSINLKDIYKKYGRGKLKNVKPISFYDAYIRPNIKGKMKILKPLMYIDYDKEKAIETLSRELDFEYYGSKHSESIFTRLYQGYILPEKFGVIKAKAHLSSLIVANQLTRDEALKQLENPEYKTNPKLLEKDIKTFIKRIDITREEFNKIINNKHERSHLSFKNSAFIVRIIKGIFRRIKVSK